MRRIYIYIYLMQHWCFAFIQRPVYINMNVVMPLEICWIFSLIILLVLLRKYKVMRRTKHSNERRVQSKIIWLISILYSKVPPTQYHRYCIVSNILKIRSITIFKRYSNYFETFAIFRNSQIFSSKQVHKCQMH